MKYWDSIEEQLPAGPIKWPNGARLCVLVAFDYQAEVGDWTFPDGTPNYGQVTEASYGGRVGIWRLLDILEKYGIPGTFNTCGVTAERYPESARAIVEAGHEIAGHGYHHELHWTLSEKEELEVIRNTVKAIKNITGETIVGYRCPLVQPSRNTLRMLVDEGFTWDGNFLNYDLPYFLKLEGGGRLLEIPYTWGTDDFPFIYGAVRHDVGGFPAPRNTMADLYQMLVDEFDVLYEESQVAPKLFVFQNHPLVVGRAHRARYFDMFMDHMKQREDVWFATFREVTDWWTEHYSEQAEGSPLTSLGFKSATRAVESVGAGV